MSILTQPLSPSFLHARQKLCIQQNTAKLPRSKDDLHSGAAREIGRTFFRGVANNTPYILRMLHTFRAAVRKWGSFFFSEAERCPCFTERMGLTFCLCHMVYKTIRKEYGILYLCLYLYCRIGILLYCCISVLSYYSLYLLFAIRLYIFFYIYISVSVSYVQPQFFSIGCAVNHHHSFLTCKGMAAQADTKHQSMLSLSAKIFCSRLPQSEIGYSTKILYRLFGLLPYWAAIL